MLTSFRESGSFRRSPSATPRLISGTPPGCAMGNARPHLGLASNLLEPSGAIFVKGLPLTLTLSPERGRFCASNDCAGERGEDLAFFFHRADARCYVSVAGSRRLRAGAELHAEHWNVRPRRFSLSVVKLALFERSVGRNTACRPPLWDPSLPLGMTVVRLAGSAGFPGSLNGAIFTRFSMLRRAACDWRGRPDTTPPPLW